MLSELKKDKMARVLRLAEKYGPFVRFYPNGSEDDDLNPEKRHDEEPVEDGSIKEGEKKKEQKPSPAEQSAIDKARASEQQLEQEQANTARANEFARQAQSDLESAKSETEKLREQLATAEAKATEAGIATVELDEKEYEGTDLAMVKAIKGLGEKLKAKDKQIASLEKKAEGYEQQDRKDKATQASNSAYEELLGDLDGEYGADCRNEAVKQFNKLASEGKVPIGRPEKATRLMEKCYKDAKAAKTKDKADKDKPSLPLDSGSGGGETPNLSGVEIKEGSLDEVDAQVAKTTMGAKKS